MPSLAEVLSAKFFPADLQSLTFPELRELRLKFQEFEVDQSYLRRLVQGHLDIARAEQISRSRGESLRASDLVEALPSILGTGIRAAGPARAPGALAPRTDGALTAELDALVGPEGLTQLDRLDPDRLAALCEDLTNLELAVSARRRLLFDRIDAIQAEITRRYRTGEAQIDHLLPPETP